MVIPCCMLTACNYLDVIPPAQADFEDTMKDQNAVENFCLPVMVMCLVVSLMISMLLNNLQMRL